jgi:serine/threonine protein kinase
MLRRYYLRLWSAVELGVALCCCWVVLMNPVSCRSGGVSSSPQRVLSSSAVAVVSSFSAPSPSPSSSSEIQECPLDFTALDKFPYVAQQAGDEAIGTTQRCLAMYDGLAILMSEYLKETSFFLVPAEMADACLQEYDTQLAKQGSTGVNFSEMCGFSASYIARGTDNCQHIQTLQDFLRPLSVSILGAVNNSCNGVLGSGNSPSILCPVCIKEMFTMAAALQLHANGSSTVSCFNYTTLYVGAFVQQSGPLDPSAVVCLWNILPGQVENVKNRNLMVVYLVIGAIVVVVLSMGAVVVIFFLYRRRSIAKQTAYVKQTTQMVGDSMRAAGDFAMVWYSLEEIKAATHNFATKTFVGSGAYANVYRGCLEDGTEIAVKRFKNCTPAGDADFVREVEALASARHRNLVSLRGCCIETVGSGVQGHQRIIVCDFMENGSLHDFLFSYSNAHESSCTKPSLDWATRQKIAIDMARGIDYLHHGAQPQILHRDIKSSNVLLDSYFNARVADFGLAKFTPDGITHMTTRAAGTPGYIAPEYALYGQLTERSDVYSFGVVLLELISGRKALIPAVPADADAASGGTGGFILIADWAWSLVKAGNWVQVLDPRMNYKSADLEDLERFVMVALLCAHPQVAYRPPTITSARRILEDGQQVVPMLPDRPLPLTLNRQTIISATAAASSAGGRSSASSNLWSSSAAAEGFQSQATISSVGSSYMAR